MANIFPVMESLPADTKPGDPCPGKMSDSSACGGTLYLIAGMVLQCDTHPNSHHRIPTEEELQAWKSNPEKLKEKMG